MQVKTAKGKDVELKEVTVNNITYVHHQELKELVRQDGVMFDFPHILSVNNLISAMCVVSNEQGVRCYGTGQAPSSMNAADLAFDNAVIDLYRIGARSTVEMDIATAVARNAAKAEEAAAKKAAQEAAAKKAAEEAAAKKAAQEAAAKKAAEEAAAKKAAQEAAAKKAAQEAAAKKAAEEAAAKKAAQEATAKKAAEEAAAKKVAEEAAAKKAAQEAAAKKAAQEAAAKKAAEEATAKKAAEEAAAKKAAQEAAAKKAAEEAATKQDSPSTAPRTGYWYANEADWVGCHSLTPNDPDDTVINYGPFKDTGENSELKPGPKYLSQVLKYRSDYIEKLIGIQPPTFMQRIAQILTYCSRQGIGLHATSSKAHNILAQYGVREL